VPKKIMSPQIVALELTAPGCDSASSVAPSLAP